MDRTRAVNITRPLGPKATVVLLMLAALSLTLGCASRTYRPIDAKETELFQRAETLSVDGVTVRAAVPSQGETKRIFGLPLYKRGIQPVWLEVENPSEHRYRFAPVGTDPEYFTAYEVAYMHKGHYKRNGFRDLEHFLHGQTMNRYIWPGETRSGWVFTHLVPGTKAFRVDLFASNGGEIGLSFFIDVPGREPDHAEIDFDTLYPEDALVELDLEGFRQALGEMPCCTRDRSGEHPGLPTNVFIVGPGNDVLEALLRAGFFERPRAEREEDLGQVPHFFGRPADAVFRRQRRGFGDRNELLLWLSPMRVDDEPVWVGQITQYVGRSNELLRALFDPRLDPNIDDARDFILQTMWYTQSLKQYAWQQISEPIQIESPERDFRGVEYFTNGDRVVLWLSSKPVSQIDTQALVWDEDPEVTR